MSKLNKKLMTIIENLNLPPKLKEDIIIYYDRIKYEKTFSNIFIYGKSGTGKTVLALSILIEFLEEKYINQPTSESQITINENYLVNFPNLLRHARNDKINYDSILNNSILIIDDIGIPKYTEWVYEILYTIINHRYEYNLQTIVTSNLNLNELIQKMGDDVIVSRIIAQCNITEMKTNYRIK